MILVLILGVCGFLGLLTMLWLPKRNYDDFRLANIHGWITPNGPGPLLNQTPETALKPASLTAP